jgi:hypothetical protein
MNIFLLKLQEEGKSLKWDVPLLRITKHFTVLGVDLIIADVMLYNIEIAQTFSSGHAIKQELFYKSMFF